MSASAAVGQMRGLQTLGVWEQVGAISAVSGGSWFGAIFSYAPTTIDDATLLGAVVEPAAITLDRLATFDPHYIAAPFTRFSTESLGAIKTAMMVAIGQQPNPFFNRLYARTLNEFLLTPFGLADPHKLLTLDQLAVARIIANNPALHPENFYTMRPDRPYFIAGAAQAYPLGADQRLRAVEMTPLYTGLPQYFPGEGPTGGILAAGMLLRRHYPIIVAFINSERPLGAVSAFTVDGIARMVTQLFGIYPPALPKPARDPQIFPRQQSEPLKAALLRAKAKQRAPWFMDSYEIVQPNAYGIPCG
jgi:hypothetical protein